MLAAGTGRDGIPLRDGSWALLHDDVDQTAAALDEHHPGDGEAWRQVHRDWTVIGPALINSLMSPFRRCAAESRC